MFPRHVAASMLLLVALPAAAAKPITYMQVLVGSYDSDDSAWQVADEVTGEVAHADIGTLWFAGGVGQQLWGDGVLQYGYEGGLLATRKEDSTNFRDATETVRATIDSSFYAVSLLLGPVVSVRPIANLRLYAAAGPAVTWAYIGSGHRRGHTAAQRAERRFLRRLQRRYGRGVRTRRRRRSSSTMASRSVRASATPTTRSTSAKAARSSSKARCGCSRWAAAFETSLNAEDDLREADRVSYAGRYWKSAGEAHMGRIHIMVLAGAVALSGCTSAFVSSWKAPEAQPLQFRGTKVAAVVMMQNEASRRAAEDRLAYEISARGAQGVPMYQIHPDGRAQNEAEARAAIEKAGMVGAIVMRPVSVDKEVVSTPVTYTGGYYGSYWGGYYGHGWGAPYATGGEIRTNTIVTIETLVFSLKQNKLVWAGQSRTTNPRDVDKVVRDLAGKVATELQKLGLISGGLALKASAQALAFELLSPSQSRAFPAKNAFRVASSTPASEREKRPIGSRPPSACG